MKTSQKLIIVLLIIFLGHSCDPDRVDTPPLGDVEANYFSNTVEFRRAMGGVYAKLYDYYAYSATGGWPSSIWQLPGDDITESSGARTAEELFDGTLNPTNGRVGWVFEQTYRMIQKANVVIEKTRTVDYSNYDGADEIASMEGEALFLRGFAYYMLFNIYGNVPLITERLTTEEINTPKSDKIKVLGQVIEDCRKAVGILPESWPETDAGRATKNSARGLLVKALVFRADYSGSTEDFNEAISVYNTMTAGLQARFLDNFDAAGENNGESLFEVQSSQPPELDNIFLTNEGGDYRGVENMSVFRGMYMPFGVGLSSNLSGTKYLVTDKLFNNFGDDPRISYFLRSDDGQDGRLYQKYSTPELDNRNTVFASSLNNERVLRMADIELMVAEAYLKTGNTQDAITHINKIRTRARTWALSDGLGDGTMPPDLSISETNQDTIMKWIMDERFVELAGEGQRWWDLKRWHVAGDIDLTGWTGAEDEFSTFLASPVQFDVNKHLLFPLPQTELERNDAILENNPGY